MERIRLAYLSDIHRNIPHDRKFLDEFNRHFEVYTFGLTAKSYYLMFRKVREFLDGVRPHVIFANYITKYPILVYLAGVRYPLISVGFGSDILYYMGFFPFPILVKKVCEKSCVIIVDSYHCREVLSRYCDRSKIEVIPFGVDTELFRRDERRNALRNRYGIEDRVVVISLRNHYRLYNIETIIKSARYFSENVVLIVAGWGKNTSKLKKMAERSKNVLFVGMLSKEGVAEHLAASDIIISVPVWDSTSVSLLEGMASCCVPIVSDIPANKEWVTNGYNGFVVETKDYREIARIVNYLADNQEVLTKMGYRNREIVLKRADWKENARKIVELIYKCSDRSSG